MITRNFLVGLLVVQSGLLAYQWWPESQSALVAHALLDLDPGAVSELMVQTAPKGDDTEASSVHLVRDGASWALASAAGYPAESSKVDEVLSSLLDIEVKRPIATQPSRHNQLNVGDATYGRRVKIVADDKSHELVIGSGGSNAVHVRVDGNDDVYSAPGLSEWSIGDQARSYVESEYVQLEPDSLTTLTIHTADRPLSFERKGSDWVLLEIPEGRQPQTSAITSLVRRAASIRMNEPVGKELEASFGFDGGVRVEWTEKTGDDVKAGGYVIGNIAENDGFVKSDASEFVVKVSKWSIERIRDAKLDELLLPLDDGGESSADSPFELGALPRGAGAGGGA